MGKPRTICPGCGERVHKSALRKHLASECTLKQAKAYKIDPARNLGCLGFRFQGGVYVDFYRRDKDPLFEGKVSGLFVSTGNLKLWIDVENQKILKAEGADFEMQGDRIYDDNGFHGVEDLFAGLRGRKG